MNLKISRLIPFSFFFIISIALIIISVFPTKEPINTTQTKLTATEQNHNERSKKVDQKHVISVATQGNSDSNNNAVPDNTYVETPIYSNTIMKEEISRDDLISYLSATTNYTDEQLRSFSDVNAFSKKLLQLSVNSDNIDIALDAPLLGRIEFAKSNVWNSGGNMSQTIFNPETPKIYAILPPMGKVREEVFVRWYNANDPELLLFQKYSTPSEYAKNHIWISNSDGWLPGTYNVEVFTENEYLDLLASGSYEITTAAQ